MHRKRPNALSIALADTVAIGHVNAGLNLYREFERLPNEKPDPTVPLDFNRTFELAVPAVTNLALGLELLLKVHHFQWTSDYPRGHDIRKLGLSFPPEALTTLRENYRSMYEDPQVSKGLEFRMTGGTNGRQSTEWKSPNTSSYDAAIEYLGPMYVKWRYIYEEFGDEVDIGVSFSPLYFTAMSVHRAIRAHKGKMRITLTHQTKDA